MEKSKFNVGDKVAIYGTVIKIENDDEECYYKVFIENGDDRELYFSDSELQLVEQPQQGRQYKFEIGDQVIDWRDMEEEIGTIINRFSGVIGGNYYTVEFGDGIKDYISENNLRLADTTYSASDVKCTTEPLSALPDWEEEYIELSNEYHKQSIIIDALIALLKQNNR